MTKQNFSKYERARIIGARGLQISMDAPLILDISKEELEGLNFDPLKIAQKELDSGVLPISVNKPMPRIREEDLKTIKVDPSTDTSDEEKIKEEEEEERDISKRGEIMGLTNDDDSIDDSFSDSENSTPEDYE